MKIIGRLLKKSTAISHKRINRRHIDYKNQLFVLRRLLQMAKHTKFGFYHNFNEIIEQSDIVSNYQSIFHIVIFHFIALHFIINIIRIKTE